MSHPWFVLFWSEAPRISGRFCSYPKVGLVGWARATREEKFIETWWSCDFWNIIRFSSQENRREWESFQKKNNAPQQEMPVSVKEGAAVFLAMWSYYVVATMMLSNYFLFMIMSAWGMVMEIGKWKEDNDDDDDLYVIGAVCNEKVTSSLICSATVAG